MNADTLFEKSLREAKAGGKKDTQGRGAFLDLR